MKHACFLDIKLDGTQRPQTARTSTSKEAPSPDLSSFTLPAGKALAATIPKLSIAGAPTSAMKQSVSARRRTPSPQRDSFYQGSHPSTSQSVPKSAPIQQGKAVQSLPETSSQNLQ